MNAINLNRQLAQMQSATNRANYENNRERVGQGNIDRNGFFQLLLTQLQNQSPLEPQDSTQQLMQQAQFTQIEELQKLNNNFNEVNMMNTASNYVGKDVSYTLNGQEKTGRIDRVSFGSNGAGLHIGNDTITLNQITELRAN